MSQHDVTGQHHRRVKILAGQVTILAGHCPLIGRYFKPWYAHVDKSLRKICHYRQNVPPHYYLSDTLVTVL